MSQNIKQHLKGILPGVAVVIVAALGFATGYQVHQPEQADPAKLPNATLSTTSEKSQLDYVNEIRAQHGVAALSEDPGLNASAKAKADDMIANHYYTHTRPNGDPFYNVIYKNAPGLRRSGENLAECNKTIAETYDRYTKSPEHLANILNPKFTVFGSAIEWDPQTLCAIDVNHFGAYR